MLIFLVRHLRCRFVVLKRMKTNGKTNGKPIFFFLKPFFDCKAIRFSFVFLLVSIRFKNNSNDAEGDVCFYIFPLKMSRKYWFIESGSEVS